MAICFCSHPQNPNKYEGNCTLQLCPLKKERNMKIPMVVTHCPNCGSKEIVTIGVSGIGTIRRCLNCQVEFIVVDHKDGDSF